MVAAVREECMVAAVRECMVAAVREECMVAAAREMTPERTPRRLQVCWLQTGNREIA